jgi:hypothetical protein
MYSIDTSFFMDWQARYYPLDVFAGLEKQIEALVKAGEFLAVDLVSEEIDAVGTPDLRAWIKNHKSIFVPLTPDVQVEAAAIEAKYPDLLDPKLPYQSADAYVIALAKLKPNGIVVSQETSVNEKHKPKRNYYIPDVCRDLGVPCINLLGLMRKEKWKL